MNERHFVNRQPKHSKFFEKVESAGTEATYRCLCCRGCKDCKTGERIEFISIQEEVEQDVINRSFKVDLNKGYVIAKLPFICDPLKRLVSNEHIAKKIFFRQIAKLNANKKDKDNVILAEQKLQDFGFVDYLENLDQIQKRRLLTIL